MALQPGVDYLAPYYRDLGMNLVFGMNAREAMLNVLGKIDDPNGGGRQMPSHWGNRERHIVSQSSVVATQFLHAAGIALGAKLRQDPVVVMATCGEGSTSRGDFHEALNFATIHRLPVIFFIENNGYAISERTDKEMATAGVTRQGIRPARHRRRWDGRDRGTRPCARRWTRRGAGAGRSSSKHAATASGHIRATTTTPATGHARNSESAAKDPIKLFRERVERDGIFPREDLDAIEARVDEEVREAAAWAQQQPDPKPEDALGFVYKEG